MIGFIGYTWFVGEICDYKSMYLEHVKGCASLVGVSSIGVSTDDMSFDLELFNQDPGDMVFDYSNVKNEIYSLLSLEFNDEEIKDIMYRNIERKIF